MTEKEETGPFNLPNLGWLERYKRMYQAYDTAIKTVFANEMERSGKQDAVQLLIAIHQEVSKSLGEKLCEKFNYSPNIKGALELMWTYSCEVWGFGMNDTVDMYIEKEDRGIFTNKICHYWETWLKHRREFSCDENCINEYTSLIRTLNPSYKLYMVKAFPRGDNCCQFVVEV